MPSTGPIPQPARDDRLVELDEQTLTELLDSGPSRSRPTRQRAFFDRAKYDEARNVNLSIRKGLATTDVLQKKGPGSLRGLASSVGWR